MLTVNDVIAALEKIAKPIYQYDWDNSGFLAGNKNRKAERVLISLDITKEVVLEAVENNCDMIISHHPLIFKAIKNASEETYEGEILSLLYKNDIALYCAHTSLDIAFGGVNDALCQRLKLKNVQLFSPFKAGEESVACARKGELEAPLSKEELLEYIKQNTGAAKLLYNLADKEYRTIALCTGAGEDFAFQGDNYDVFLTGEIKYHTALEMKRRNISFIAAGHYYTEVHVVHALAVSLQKSLNMIEYIESKVNTNPFQN